MIRANFAPEHFRNLIKRINLFIFEEIPEAMKKYFLLLTALLLVALVPVACKNDRNIPGHSGMPELAPGSDSLLLARPITYDVVIRNPNPEDTWTAECLAGMDQQALTDFVFSALYEKKLTAYDFYTDKPLPVRKIKKIEQAMNNDRSRLAKIQFTENWYLDTARMTMDKKVTSMMFGYEVYDANGDVRGYKAAFRINLNEK